MNYEVDRAQDVFGEPSLTELVEKALQVLQRSDNGYFLLIEGGCYFMHIIQDDSLHIESWNVITR